MNDHNEKNHKEVLPKVIRRGGAVRFFLAILPTALTPLLAYLIADGTLNFGGGEKDLVLLLPWLVWSFIYMVCFIVLWIKRVSLLKSLVISGVIALLIIVVLWLILLVWQISTV